jgi:hypothetical protein
VATLDLWVLIQNLYHLLSLVTNNKWVHLVIRGRLLLNNLDMVVEMKIHLMNSMVTDHLILINIKMVIPTDKTVEKDMIMELMGAEVLTRANIIILAMGTTKALTVATVEFETATVNLNVKDLKKHSIRTQHQSLL